MRQAGLPDPEFREEMDELQRLLRRGHDCRRNCANAWRKWPTQLRGDGRRRRSLEALERLARGSGGVAPAAGGVDRALPTRGHGAGVARRRGGSRGAGPQGRQALADAMEEGDNPRPARAASRPSSSSRAESLLDRMEDIRERRGTPRRARKRANRPGNGRRSPSSGRSEARQDMTEARERAEAGQNHRIGRDTRPREAAEALQGSGGGSWQEARAEMTETMEDAARQALRQTADRRSLAWPASSPSCAKQMRPRGRPTEQASHASGR